MARHHQMNIFPCPVVKPNGAYKVTVPICIVALIQETLVPRFLRLSCLRLTQAPRQLYTSTTIRSHFDFNPLVPYLNSFVKNMNT